MTDSRYTGATSRGFALTTSEWEQVESYSGGTLTTQYGLEDLFTGHKSYYAGRLSCSLTHVTGMRNNCKHAPGVSFYIQDSGRGRMEILKDYKDYLSGLRKIPPLDLRTLETERIYYIQRGNSIRIGLIGGYETCEVDYRISLRMIKLRCHRLGLVVE